MYVCVYMFMHLCAYACTYVYFGGIVGCFLVNWCFFLGFFLANILNLEKHVWGKRDEAYYSRSKLPTRALFCIEVLLEIWLIIFLGVQKKSTFPFPLKVDWPPLWLKYAESALFSKHVHCCLSYTGNWELVKSTVGTKFRRSHVCLHSQARNRLWQLMALLFFVILWYVLNKNWHRW